MRGNIHKNSSVGRNTKTKPHSQAVPTLGNPILLLVYAQYMPSVPSKHYLTYIFFSFFCSHISSRLNSTVQNMCRCSRHCIRALIFSSLFSFSPPINFLYLLRHDSRSLSRPLVDDVAPYWPLWYSAPWDPATTDGHLRVGSAGGGRGGGVLAYWRACLALTLALALQSTLVPLLRSPSRSPSNHHSSSIAAQAIAICAHTRTHAQRPPRHSGSTVYCRVEYRNRIRARGSMPLHCLQKGQQNRALALPA